MSVLSRPVCREPVLHALLCRVVPPLCFGMEWGVGVTLRPAPDVGCGFPCLSQRVLETALWGGVSFSSRWFQVELVCSRLLTGTVGAILGAGASGGLAPGPRPAPPPPAVRLPLCLQAVLAYSCPRFCRGRSDELLSNQLLFPSTCKLLLCAIIGATPQPPLNFSFFFDLEVVFRRDVPLDIFL